MTPEQRQAATQVLQIIADTIKDSKDQGTPLGPLYAALMSRGMSYDTFTNIIGTMQGIGLIKVQYHCAFWIAGRVQ
jgi:hypothetical protein